MPPIHKQDSKPDIAVQACQITDSSDSGDSTTRHRTGFQIAGRVEQGKETLSTQQPEAQLPNMTRFTLADPHQHKQKLQTEIQQMA